MKERIVTHLVAGGFALIVAFVLFKLAGNGAPFIVCVVMLYSYNLDAMEKAEKRRNKPEVAEE